MTLLRKIARWAFVALALCSCSKKVTVITVDEVHFTASVKSYSTKASDSGFENGDKVRIVAGYPIDETSVGAVNGNSLLLDTPMHWTKDQTASTTFAAIYQAGKVADAKTSLTYDLLAGGKHDYSAHNQLLTAVRTVAPLTTVDFVFSHPFSKMVLDITNNLSGDAISKVEITDLLMKGTVNLTEKALDLSGSPTKFEPFKLSSGQYAAVVMPQTAAPEVVVTTTSGVVYKFQLDEPFVFEAGYAYSASLTLNPLPNPDSVVFTFHVTPWEDGGSLDYELEE